MSRDSSRIIGSFGMLKAGDQHREGRGEAGTPAIGPRQPRGRCQRAAPSGPVVRISVMEELHPLLAKY